VSHVTTPAVLEFEGFYQAHFAEMVTIAYGHTADLGEAQDIAQEAFCRAWQRWRQVSEYDSPATWVRRVALNLAHSRWRRLKSAVAYQLKQVHQDVPELDADHVAIVAALRKLPAAQREAIVLHYMMDLPLSTVAEHLDAPVGTVKSWLHRGRAALVGDLSIDIRGDVKTPPVGEVVQHAGRHRRRRQTLLAAVVVLLLVAVTIVVRLAIPESDAPPVQPPPQPSPRSSCSAAVNLKLPDSESDIRLRLYNGTSVVGLEQAAATDLRSRKFVVVQAVPQTSTPLNTEVVAVVSFGPAGTGSAWIVRAYLGNRASIEFDPTRQDADVDLILGPSFRQFATLTEMREVIAGMGAPVSPC
jgi:RNA polymerase sigma-70 factor (sigma-E family)